MAVGRGSAVARRILKPSSASLAGPSASGQMYGSASGGLPHPGPRSLSGAVHYPPDPIDLCLWRSGGA
eukprot:7672582-Alexandrium_andersonii.AAC.1